MDSAQELRQISLTELRPHPKQDSVFTAISDGELQQLASDIDDRGLQQPIHILADGTIVSGHQRVRAAWLLGWDTITAVIRDDLGDADSLTSVEHLVRENLHRRHLDDLAIARCYRELKRSALLCGRVGGGGKVRDRLAAQLPGEMSGRTLDRLERLLELPRDIQDMISQHRLNKSQAEKILRLPQKGREAAYEALRGGQLAKQVVMDLDPEKGSSEVTTFDLAQSLANFIHEHVDELSEHPDDLDAVFVKGADLVELLDRAAMFFAAWRDRKQAMRECMLEDLQERLPVHPQLARAQALAAD